MKFRERFGNVERSVCTHDVVDSLATHSCARPAIRKELRNIGKDVLKKIK